MRVLVCANGGATDAPEHHHESGNERECLKWIRMLEEVP